MKMRILTTAVVLLLTAGASWAAADKYGAAALCSDGESNDIHDAGLYHLWLRDTLWTGDNQSRYGCGNYPGATGPATVYAGIAWVGTNSWGTPRVSGGYAAHNVEWYNLQGLLWSDGPSWNERPSYIEKRGVLDSYVMADDRNAGEEGPIGLVVEQHGMQWDDATNDDYIIIQDFILNESGRNLTDEYVCLYYDFDIGGSLSYIDDKVGIDSPRKMPYAYDDDPAHPYVGLRILDGKPHSLGVPAFSERPNTDAEMWAAMTSGEWIAKTEPYDWTVCLSSGPHVCANNDKLRLAFAIVAGANLSELQANADAAYNKYWEIHTGVDKFWARALPGKVEINWEPNDAYAGFNVLRAEAEGGGSAVKVNDNLITGRPPFKFLDLSVAGDATYAYTLEAVTLNGGEELYGPIRVTAQGKTKPLSFSLAQSFPNPAAATATIAYTLAEGGDVSLELFDLSGRKITTLAEGYRPAGENEALVDVGELAAGVYVYRLRAGDNTATKKLAVLK